MKKPIALLVTLFCCLTVVQAQFTTAPAFPGAEGYARYTIGGRGGQVYHVTRLDDYIDNVDYSIDRKKDNAENFKGTLRYAVNQKGPRTIVFDVAGTINLKCPLKIANDSITILGQTAPGDGICLKNYTLGINANNVIIRYIRCRMGDEGKRYWDKGVQLTNTAYEDDAMNAYHKAGMECNNIIIDHCSMSWCVDECGTFYGNKDFTLQWCILSESLRISVHDKGAHGYAGIWGGQQATFHHNLIADHDSRNPRFDHGYVNPMAGPVDYINNVVYNWGHINSSYGGETFPDAEAKKFNMINNYYKPGPATDPKLKTRLLNPTSICKNCNHNSPNDAKPGQFYLKGNVVEGAPIVAKNNYSTVAIAFDKKSTIPMDKMYALFARGDAPFTVAAPEFQYATVSTQAAEKAFEKVLQYAGASFARDAVDARIADEAKTGTFKFSGSKGSTGGLIDTPNDVGGYPVLSPGTKLPDSDNDGMPDAWEKANGLNPNDAADAIAYTLDGKKYYTNLEVYANSIVEDKIKAQRADATETFEEYYPVCKKATSK